MLPCCKARTGFGKIKIATWRFFALALLGEAHMHDTAFEIGRKFFEIYLKNNSPLIVEIGAFNVNGSLRDCCPEGVIYLGLDFKHGPGVDIVIKPKEAVPLRSEFADVIVSTSQMEHDPVFWTTFLELVRVLKQDGILYLNAPSNGCYHRYPADCWRFYPDSGKALEEWARSNGYDLVLVESFIAERMADQWNDFVAVFKKADTMNDSGHAFLSDHVRCTNVRMWKSDVIVRARDLSEDMVLLNRSAAEAYSIREDAALLTAERPDLQEAFAGASETARTIKEAPHDRLSVREKTGDSDDARKSFPDVAAALDNFKALRSRAEDARDSLEALKVGRAARGS
jgi:SAM-dependent methyltransferase